jgi:hypothetical protein
MTLQEFNNKIVEYASRITGIWKYSYTRQGFKFDPQNPKRFLDSEERQLSETLISELEQFILTSPYAIK